MEVKFEIRISKLETNPNQSKEEMTETDDPRFGHFCFRYSVLVSDFDIRIFGFAQTKSPPRRLGRAL
jgi:hypothetical protein